MGGGFVYIAMFRRPLLAGLNALWRRIIELEEGSRTKEGSIGRSSGARVDPVHCLDPACLHGLPYGHLGGGHSQRCLNQWRRPLCERKELSPYGLAAAQAQCRGDVLSQDDVEPILVVSLFDGIGALRVAVDALRVPVAGYI